MSSRPPTLVQNPALDGLRGFAVLVTVLYHTHNLVGGWLGVEAFFVLSGYLITSLLMREFDTTGSISLRGFWARRARRLLPALFALLGIVAVFARLVSKTTAYDSLRLDVLGVLTYTANWVSIYGGGGYWAQFQDPSPLRHAWSLAIEEQFYVLFPFVALAVLRLRRRAWVVGGLALVALGRQLWVGAHGSVDRVYLGTDTRAFGLLVGATLALVAAPRLVAGARLSAVARRAGPLAAVGLAVLIVTLDGSQRGAFLGPLAVASVLVAVVLSGVVGSNLGSPLATVLSLGPLRAVGRWSYGIYLYHWPLTAALLRTELSPRVIALIVLAVSIPVAAVSFRYLEAPIRHHGLATVGGLRVALPTAAALGATALVATTIGATSLVVASDVLRAAPPPQASTVVAPVNASGLVTRPSGRPLRVFVVGDSVGHSMVDPLTSLQQASDFVLFSRAAPSCSYDRTRTSFGDWIEDDSCVRIVESWASDVRTFRPDLVLFVYGSWSEWDYEGAARSQCDPVLSQHVDELYDQAVADLSSSGARVFFVTPGDWRAPDVIGPPMPKYECTREHMRAYTARHPQQTGLVDLYPLLCSPTACQARAGGELVRGDGIHYSGPGATTIAVTVLRGVMTAPARGWPTTVPIVTG